MTISDREKICLSIMRLFGSEATEADVISVLMSLLVGKTIYLSSTKDEAIEKLADLSAQALIMIESFQSADICHWRDTGESIQ
jgi:TRAP-type C4-dicarboxylate transport system permease large subunit